MRRWLDQLAAVADAIRVVRANVVPAIEADTGIPFSRPDLVILALFQPSTRNLFAEIGDHFRGTGACALSDADLERLAGLSDAAAALAWIGDAALKIGVLREIWNPDVRDAGLLTERRKRYESNANMARLCDRWHLYEHRIRLENDTAAGERDHLKGTLVESVYAILFLEGGLARVAEAVHLLRPQGIGE
ncbi:MAG: hypothetical protein GKC04_00700 [Methanomicrobiales archaeon]|nr:hypothetical protein [Methanomicrobiales archaeon]